MDKRLFGNFLANLRNEKRLTQEQLSEKLNVNSKTISKWECGSSIPDFETLIKISEIFGISLYELSQCKRIDNVLVFKNTLNKIKNKHHFIKHIWQKGIIIGIVFIIIISIIFCMGYTIKNFDKCHVYSLVSDTKEYFVEGILTEYNGINYLSIGKIEYTGNDDKNNKLMRKKIKSFEYYLKTQSIITEKRNINIEANEILKTTFQKINFHLINVQENIDDINIIVNIIDDKNNKQTISIKVNLAKP